MENKTTTTRQDFFINDYDRIFTVRLLWSIGQPTVFGRLDKVIEYALKPNNGIEGFYEIVGTKMRKMTKKELRECYFVPQSLMDELFKVY